MNIIDIVLIIIILLTLFVGYKRGILLSLLSLCTFFVKVPVSYYIADNYSKAVYDNFIRERIVSAVSNRITDSKSLEDFITSINDTVKSLPDFIANGINTKSLTGLSAKEVAVYLTDNIFQSAAQVLTKIVLFILAFVIISLLFFIIECIIKAARKNKDSKVKKAGDWLGFVFGLVKATMILLVVSAVSYYIVDEFGTSNSFFALLDKSVIISFINEINPILKMI